MRTLPERIFASARFLAGVQYRYPHEATVECEGERSARCRGTRRLARRDRVMPSLSASTLKLFQECPRCFWLHLNKKVERPRGPFPSLPSGIDRVLKHYFEAYRHQPQLPPLIAGKLDGTLSTTALTLGYTDPVARARLWGKLDDCVILADGRLAPLDHKTRASAPEDISYSEMYYKFQMDVYTLLLERNGHRTSRTAYLVYYFPVDGVLHDGFPFGIVVHRLTTDPDSAHQIFLSACRCLEGPMPEPGPVCEFCRWAQTRESLLSPVQTVIADRPERPAPPIRRRSPAPPPPHTRSTSPAGGVVPDDLFA